MKPAEALFIRLIKHGVFSVDEEGRIWREQIRCRTGRWLPIRRRRAEQTISGGYLQLRIVVNKIRYCCQAHRIVWTYFKGPIPRGYEIDHDDGDKTNNRLANLDCVTAKVNSQRAYAKGLKKPPVRPLNGIQKIDMAIARKIRRLYATGRYRQVDIGKRFSLTQTSIGRIVRGLAWPESE